MKRSARRPKKKHIPKNNVRDVNNLTINKEREKKSQPEDASNPRIYTNKRLL
jgi:hypothetical protein